MLCTGWGSSISSFLSINFFYKNKKNYKGFISYKWIFFVTRKKLIYRSRVRYCSYGGELARLGGLARISEISFYLP